MFRRAVVHIEYFYGKGPDSTQPEGLDPSLNVYLETDRDHQRSLSAGWMTPIAPGEFIAWERNDRQSIELIYLRGTEAPVTTLIARDEYCPRKLMVDGCRTCKKVTLELDLGLVQFTWETTAPPTVKKRQQPVLAWD